MCVEYVNALNKLFRFESLENVNKVSKIFGLGTVKKENDEYSIEKVTSIFNELFKENKGEEHYPRYSLVFNALWLEETTNTILTEYLENWVDTSLSMSLQMGYNQKVRRFKKANDLKELSAIQSETIIDGLTTCISEFLEELGSGRKENFDEKIEEYKRKLLAGEDITENSDDEEESEEETVAQPVDASPEGAPEENADGESAPANEDS